MPTDTSEPILQQIRPVVVPGARTLFLLAVVIATFYLAIIFVTSPGQVEKYNHPKTGTTPSHVQP